MKKTALGTLVILAIAALNVSNAKIASHTYSYTLQDSTKKDTVKTPSPADSTKTKNKKPKQ